jgi:Ca2+/Na+ antiporter
VNRTVDRRAVFFLCAAVVCALTLLVTPDEYRWVGYMLIVTYVVLAVASYADLRSRGRG